MDGKMLRRVLKGLGANAYGQLVTVVVQLLGVPILLHAWGSQLYGEWLILFAIPAYLSVTDLGFSQSVGNDMTARVSRGDRVGALVAFQSLAALVFCVATLGLILTIVLLRQFQFQEWLHFQVLESESAHWILLLFAAEAFVRLPDGVTHAGFRATGDYALHVGLTGTARLLQFAGVWVAALAGGGPVAAAVFFFGIRALATLTFALLLVHRHRWLRFGFVHAQRAELRRLSKPALANIAIPLAQALNVQGMLLVVGALLGPLAVVVFSTLRTLTRLPLQLVLAVSHAAEPELAVAYGVGDQNLMRSLFVHVLRAGLWLALFSAAGLTVFGPFLLDVWTHGKVPMHPELFAWLLASAVASVLWFNSMIVLKAANQHLGAASVYVLVSASGVGVAVLLLIWMGNVANAGFALLIMDIALAFYTLRSATKLLDARLVESLSEAANPFPFLRLARDKVFMR